MLIGGFWHGAAWTFVLWGAWHGSWLVLERMLGRRSFYSHWPQPLRRAATFTIVLGGWILFRSEGLSQAFDIAGSMIGLSEHWQATLRPHRPLTLPLLALVVAAVLAFAAPNTQKIAAHITWPKAIFAYLAFVLGIQQMLQTGFNPFLYYQF